MKRLHLIELSDLAWCPRGIRHGAGDYSRFIGERSGVFNPVTFPIGYLIGVLLEKAAEPGCCSEHTGCAPVPSRSTACADPVRPTPIANSEYQP